METLGIGLQQEFIAGKISKLAYFLPNDYLTCSVGEVYSCPKQANQSLS